MLSDVGTLIVCSITFLVSALQLTHWRLFSPLYRGLQWTFQTAFRFNGKESQAIKPPGKKEKTLEAPRVKEIAPLNSNALLRRPQMKEDSAIFDKSMPTQFPKRPIKPIDEERISLPSGNVKQSMPVLPISLPEKAPLNKRELALEAQKVINGDFQGYKLPPPSLLTDAKKNDQGSLKKDLQQQAQILEETLLSFGIEAKVGQIYCGPTITSFEVHPAVGVKVQKIKALESDIALNLQAKSIRIIAPIPGKAAVGIEIPSPRPQEVSFKEMLIEYQQQGKKLQIPAFLGKTVSGEDVIADLVKMPHCIIAGATGSGKSVCINTVVMSILMTAKPDEIKLLMVDPKKVELTAYSQLPHMLSPVITEPAQAFAALNWLVKEMERRYNLLKKVGSRNIIGFNGRTPEEKKAEGEEQEEIPDKLPYIVAIIDELADLMMLSTHDLETPIARIAQMARAVGIHLILATQRPSREVITGLIRANFPTRIAFKVSSRVNSQIILDDTGAESLLGNGDMLFLPPGTSNLMRAQGAFIRDEDINKVVAFIAEQAPASYVISSFEAMVNELPSSSPQRSEEKNLDSLYDQAVSIVRETGNASTTFLQRKLKIGYARAASLMDQLEKEGVVGPADGAKPRKIIPAKNMLGRESSYSDDLFLEDED
jgi:S-DNA-T family DNA segregation ATPase FtsK/SpoIIIE